MKYVAYYRVSTEKQGDSGLGLEAQQQAVESFVGATASIIASYTEVESGSDCERPQIAKALAHAKRSDAILIVAKLDRLARNVAFVANLLDSGVEFLCCDLPYANRLTIHILSAVAEDELRRISERTRAALQRLKERGVKLGARSWKNPSPEIWKKIAAKASVTRRAHTKALWRKHTQEYSHLAAGMWHQGFTMQDIARVLNLRGLTTPAGHKWGGSSVKQLLRVCGLMPDTKAIPRSMRKSK